MMNEEKIFKIIAQKHGVSEASNLQIRKGLILKEFREAESTLDIMGLYSYFFVNCAQNLYKELYALNAQEANSYSDSMLIIISRILSNYFDKIKTPCKKEINMLIEITFQLVAIRKDSDKFIASKIIEIVSSRMLDGPNLSLSAIVLIYLITLSDNALDEQTFIQRYKVRKENKRLIKLFYFLFFVINKLEDESAASDFLKKVSLASSEIYSDLQTRNDFRESNVVLKIRTRELSSELSQFNDLFTVLGVQESITKQVQILQNTLKKAYYSIAMRQGKSYQQKLKVLERLMKENIEITPSDTDMIKNLVIKIENREEFKKHFKFLDSLAAMCNTEDNVNSICYLFLMLIFEEISKFCKKHNDRGNLVRLFLKIQFIRFPKELINFRQYKCMLIKYFPFYMMKNLSFLNQQDPIADIIIKHNEFTSLFEKTSKKTQIDGLDINLINPLDAITSAKMKELLASDSADLEHIFEMLRLEVEIWENFINQVSNFDKHQRKSYQSMLRSVIFHNFLKKFPSMKAKKMILMGNFLHNLCIRNDELVKLILNQGFSVDLIDHAVKYIEWFHVCLLYCDTLLSNKIASKKLHFYYRLLVSTIKKYPARISKDVARNLIVNHFPYVELNPEENQVVLECVTTMIQAFPSLEEEKRFLISRYKSVQKELCPFDITYIYIDRLTKDLDKILTTQSSPISYSEFGKSNQNLPNAIFLTQIDIYLDLQSIGAVFSLRAQQLLKIEQHAVRMECAQDGYRY